MAVASMVLVYICWRDWLPLRRNTAATAVFADARMDEPPSRRRRIVFLLTGLVLPAQLACLVWISEPYPAPVGPLFMGNPDVGGQGRSFRQEFSVVEAGQVVSMSAAVLLGVPEPYATNIATFRFPLGPVSVAGFPVGQQTWYERLATQGHKFSALPFHQLHDRLSDAERIYLARRFPRAERLEISWWRDALRAEAGQLTIDRTQLNTYSLALRP
jgi:hypothetical protein